MSRRPLAPLAAIVLLTALASPIVAAEPGTSAPERTSAQGSGRTELRQRTGPGFAPQAVAPGTVGIVSSIGYVYNGGASIAVVGEVLNNTIRRRLNIEVRATLYNNANQVVGTLTEVIFTGRLAYGSLSPFVVFGPTPAGATQFTAAVIDSGVAITTPAESVLHLTVGPPQIVGDTRTYGGQIGNLSLDTTTAYVAVTTYDAAGDVLDANWTNAIALGATSETSWSVDIFYDPMFPVARAEVTAQAWNNTNENDYHVSLDNFFDDIGVSSFRSDILFLYEEGITKGCSQGKYCPTANVQRGEMASFLSRALGLTGIEPDAFTDDNGTTHEKAINQLAAAGITSGCAPNLYCPTANVQRGAMASFLSRALELTGNPPDAFTDDNGTTHELNINRVAAAGITSGCGGGKYCPFGLVTRAQMAAFLHRAFD